ncbi:hypothetical protein SDC9_111642 [bioreactor metagenome]|uniref:DUF624 domain-containing protein n=1 Tax=bioreactor metagenome TaxID=1076179 RepID=A0A645BNA6_9ZZZZ
MNDSFDGGERKETGLSLLFRIAIKKLLLLIALNLLFCVSVLPVVTLPNALGALYRCAGLILREEDFPLGKTFFAAFRSEFFKTFASGWVVLLLLLGAVYGAVFYWSVSASAALVFAMLCTVMAVYFYLAASNLFYMLSRVRLPFGALLKNAFLMVFLQPIVSTAVCLLSFLVLAATAWWFPRTLPVVILIACSFAALLACYGVRDKIEKDIVS